MHTLYEVNTKHIRSLIKMGKNKKGFNWKSRQVVETSIDNSKTKKILVEGIQSEKYDDCNALVIPSEKRKTKKKYDNVVVKKFLSKKQRKLLQQIVDRRKKKEKRSSLLDALSQVQASPDLLNKLVPITKYQTYGLKRMEQELSITEPSQQVDPSIDALKGYSKRRKLLNSDAEPNKISDPNIVGFEDSSESSEEESDVEEVNKESENDTLEISNKEGKPDNAIEENNDNDMDISSNKTDDCLIESNESKVEKVIEENCKPLLKTMVQCSPAVFIPLNRLPSVQEARLKLPILGEEQIIMEAISESDVVVLAGETGSGKTTQLPQFLYEAGYARNKIIGITEPRRVAAVSMSKRVAYEMGLSSNEVSYLIRYEGNVTEKTQIKFMTDGVLLKEIQSDFTLSRYSVIVLDEAHERSVYTDILLGLLSRVVPLRRKQGNILKLIIMSATLRLEDFLENQRLFKVPPPVIKVESRQFPVTIHFNKRTRENYLREAYLKACKIHTQLPDGGILIFLTGQQEVKTLVNKLRKTFPYRNNKNKESLLNKLSDGEKDCNSEDECHQYKKKRTKFKKSEGVPLPIIDLDEFPVVTTTDDGDELALDDEDDHDIEDIVSDPLATRAPMWVLPLYSLLPANKQAKVFEPPPSGARLCVVATNVAETSLTIPSVRYVVDCGKEKRRQFDKVTGVSAFMIAWTSKASADQRAGRAGRTGPGHCYRLYSSAVFNDEFEQYSVPEMQRKPVDDLVLQMKSMGIYKVINFPFPSPPDVAQLQAAERKLCILGALKSSEKKNTGEWEARITPLGHSMAAFPVSPRFAKMLALSHQEGLLPYTVCMVAALAVPEVLLDISGNKGMMQIRRAWAGTGNSLLLGDPMVLMRAIGAAEHDGYSGNIEKFCEKHALRYKAVVEVRKLRLQLTAEINLSVADIDITVDPKMTPPSEEQARLLRQLLLSGLGDQVAHRVDPDTFKDQEDRIKWKNAYRCGELDEPVRIHSTSVLKREAPMWVVYQEVFETNDNKLFMRGVTAIEPEWLPLLVPSLCNLSEPLMEPSPHYDEVKDQIICHVTGTYGRAAWTLPLVQIDFPSGLMRYKWFAKFFLNGSVCPVLASYSKELLSSPSSVTKSWARLQPRTELFLKALISEEVDSRRKLFNKWEKDTKYLLHEYLKWLPESIHTKVSSIWPPVHFSDS